ncbi:MAG TPA: hypothetical protein VLC98_06625 [Phnomibacter sp.]|nr:hypothetical protein [Phnomibacter sp.]
MQEEIKIGDCSSCRPLDGEETKYQTEIITTRFLWKENSDTNNALQQSPVAGRAYTVFLQQPVKFRLHMQFWLFYDCPKAFYDGYENEAEIEQARFCYGQLSKIISHNEAGATIEFTVIKTLTIQEVLDTLEMKELPGFLADTFIQAVNEDDYAFKSIGKYFQLSTSYAQGDMGQSCIFTQYKNTYTICLLSEWAFTQDWTLGVKYVLPESIRQAVMNNVPTTAT